LDLSEFLREISIWAIPVIVAITLHEVAHGWVARLCGDRTAELLGRLGLNPLGHVDPVGTLLVPAVLLPIGLPVIGWAKPVPVATGALRYPRLTLLIVTLAGPVANLIMIGLWCAVLAVIVRVHGNVTLIHWIALMSQAGIKANMMLALFNLVPIPPFDCGRMAVGLMPQAMAARIERVEPVGFLIVIGLAALHLFDWMLSPANQLATRAVGYLLRSAA
jgi:Zn-dependent protease